MAVFYLIGALTASFLIGLILKIGELRGYERWAVIAANYLSAVLLSTVFVREFSLNWPVILFGLGIGSLFPLGFVLFSRGLKEEGITATVTVGRLSLALPVIVSILLWGEQPGILEVFSLLIIGGVILLWEGRIGHVSLLLIMLFLCFGTIDSGLKFFKLRYPQADQGLFLFSLFVSALLWSWIYLGYRRIRVRRKELVGGLLLGIPNFFSSYFVLQALKTIPAYITFPFINTGLIILSALAGYFLFRESLDRRKAGLILAGTVAVIILTS